MLLAGCVAFALSAAFPFSAQAPVHFYELGATICFAAAPIAFLAGDRFPNIVFPVMILGGIALLGIAVALARTPKGTALTTSVFEWVAVFLAYFLTWRAAVTYMTLAMVTLNLSLIANETHWERHARSIFTASFVAIFLILARLVARLRRQATTDDLTGLLNRTGLAEAARRTIPKALRKGPVTLCAIDLDNFKVVNDEIGHVRADALLVDLARQWRSTLGSRAIVSRYGGDEFILVLLGVDDVEGLVEELRVGSPLAWSIGYAPLAGIDDLPSSIELADAMLYRAKAQSRAVRGAAPRIEQPSR
jgi:diguanylate cyclase (GGDEF)-like protein